MKKKKKIILFCFSTFILLITIYGVKANTIWTDDNVMEDWENGIVGHYEFATAGAGNTYLNRWSLNGVSARNASPVRLQGDNGGRINETIQAEHDSEVSDYYGASGNSSSSILSKPSSNAKIVKAYLIQESTIQVDNVDILARLPMTLKGPQGGVVKATPSFNTVYTSVKNVSGHTQHGATVTDVTDFVQSQGFGTYEGWDIPYYIKRYQIPKWTSDRNASWKLIAICEDENLPMRVLTLKMGNVMLQTDPLDLTIEGSGIKTKATGNVTGQLLIGAIGGDIEEYGSANIQLSASENHGFYNLTSGKSGEVNESDKFFQGIYTVDGVPRSDVKALGYGYMSNLPYHNNDFVVMNVNSTQSSAQNGHNAYFVNNSSRIVMRGVANVNDTSITALGMTVDIDVATYKSSISHTGQAWQNIPLQMSAHLQNNTNTSKANIGVSGGYATIKVDSNIKLDSKSVVATFFDKSSNQKITLPSNMISVNGNTITVKYGKDSNAISQVGDTLDVSFKGIPSKTGSYTNSISMYANGIVDENGYSHVQNNTFYLTSSKDTFSSKYNNPPTISATNKSFYEGEYTATYWKDTLRWQGVKASDKEDGTYTKNQIKIVSDNVNVNKQGTYKVVYSVTDSVGQKATATSTVTVKYNNPPVINAKDRTFYEGSCTQTYWQNTLRWKDVSASDKEDTPNGTYPRNRITITADNVNVNKPGTYKVTYKVTDNFGKTTIKTVTIKVIYNNPPTITGEDRWFFENETITNQMLLERVKANDIEDGNITKKTIIKNHNVQSGVIGDYTITYKVTDAFGKSAETTNKIHIVKKVPTGDEYKTRLRFISKKYINTLEPNSIWRTPEYAEILNNTLNKTQNSQAKEHWKLMPEDIQKIKDFNDQHGWSEESNQLFLEQFRYLLQ